MIKLNRRVFPIFVLLLLLVFGGMAVFVYNVVSAPLLRNIELRLEAMLTDVTNDADSFLSAKVAELQALAQVEALAELRAEQALLSMRTLQENDPDFELLVLSDLAGNTHVTRGNVQAISDRPYWRQALFSKQTVIGEPVLSRFSARPVIPIAVPVISVDGKLQAVLVGVIPVEKLSRLLLGVNQGSNQAFLVQSNGRLAYHPQESLVLSELSTAVAPIDSASADTVAAGGQGELRLDHANESWRLYYAPLKSVDWVAGLLLNEQEMLAPFLALQQAVLIGGLLSALLLLAGGWILLRRTSYEVRLQDMASEHSRMQSLFRDMYLGAIITDRAGLVTTVNPRAQNITGWSEADAQGLPLDRIVCAPTAGKQVSRLVEACVDGEKPEVTELVITTRSEVKRRVRVDASAMVGLNQEIHGIALLIWDVTNLRANEAKLNHYDLLSGRTRDIMVVLSLDGQVLDANTAAVRAYGYPRSELIGLDVRVLRKPGTSPHVDELLQQPLEQGIVFETWHQRADGSLFPVEVSSQLAKQGGQDVVVNIIHDISERQQAEAEIRQLSFHDRLTGLHNRLYLEQQLAALGEQDLPVTLVVGDVNGLKLANDAFGHQVGDQLLQQIGQIVRACAGEHTVVRWGGDEFVILMLQTGAETAQQVMDCIWTTCQQAPVHSLAPSLALGSATRTVARQPIQEVWRQAEDRMYRNKLSQGRGVRSAFISSLRTALAERSHETEEHCLRMQNMGLVLGRAAGFSESELDELQLLALLHDLGKVAIPDRILLKPGPLTEDEWGTMRQHSEIGYRIAQATPEMVPIANAILAHHERWDGSGYPLGLTGERIPRLARLIAILDAYDVMTHDRVYQPAISSAAALQQIAAGAGQQFDPDLVQVFLQLCAAGGCPVN